MINFNLKVLILILTLFSCENMSAQQEKMLKEIWFKDNAIQNEFARISLVDIFAKDKLLKLKLKVENLQKETILLKSNELLFTINGVDIPSTEKWILIEPNTSEKQTIDLKGKDFRCNKFTFKPKGIYSIPNDLKGIPGPDFILTKNDKEISIGDFKVTMVDLKKETSVTIVKFKLEYTGDRIGFVDPNKVVVMMPDKKEYAQKPAKGSSLVLGKGEKEIFVVRFTKENSAGAGDMQLVEMVLKWKDAFKECVPEKINLSPIDIEKDELTTYDKNH